MFLTYSNRGINEIWRYVAGVFLVILCYGLGQLPLELAIYIQTNNYQDIGTSELDLFKSSLDFSIIHLSKNTGLILLLSMFLIAMISLYCVVRFMHKKNFIDIITSRSAVDYRRIFFAFGIWLGLAILIEFVMYLIDPEGYTAQLDLEKWLVLLLISIVLLPIQTSFEELFFRGYILQGVAYHTRHRVIAMIVSSVLFALMHATNPEIQKYGAGLMFTYYIMAAMFLALITVWDNGLELALGAHWATNFFGALLFTYDGSVLQTDSMFKVHKMNVIALIITFIIASYIFILICKRKYGWPKLQDLSVKIEWADR
jgi:uncharacterized protein